MSQPFGAAVVANAITPVIQLFHKSGASCRRCKRDATVRKSESSLVYVTLLIGQSSPQETFLIDHPSFDGFYDPLHHGYANF